MRYSKIFGKTKDGKQVCIIDSIDIYFWAIPKKENDVKSIEKKLSKISVNSVKIIKTLIEDKKFNHSCVFFISI